MLFRPALAAAGLALLAFALLAACGDDDENAGPAVIGTDVTSVERQLLAETPSERAPGQVLQLTRVVIPVGAELAAHTHPGHQMAVIVQGTLTYTVIDGEVPVTRAAGTAGARTETVGAGQTVEINVGDSLIEVPGMVHRARNGGSVPVVIYLSSLFEEGAPPSSPAP